MKIPTHCPFCSQRLMTNPEKTVYCSECKFGNYFRFIIYRDNKSLIDEVRIIHNGIELNILPYNKIIALYDLSPGFKLITKLPIIDIDLSSKEDIINKLNFILTFQ